jgi:chromate transporter
MSLEVAKPFLRLGLTGFGGPAAHASLMLHEFVHRRRWLSETDYLDLLSATNLLPGPNSTEMAIHLGFRRAGWQGLAAAGLCFLVPACLMSALAAHFYKQSGSLPGLLPAMAAIQPVVIAIIASAVVALSCKACRTPWLWLLSAASGELTVLALAALSALRPKALFRSVEPLTLGLIFLKIGSVLYGSGYVLVAFLRAELVENRHWLTDAQLLDAITVGQATPGPLFSSSAFVGYLLAGWPGALAASIGIFLPAFLFVAASGWLIPRLRTPQTAGILDAVNAASLGLMAAVSIQLAAAVCTSPIPIAATILSLAILLKYSINPAWLMLAAAAFSLRQFPFPSL